MNLDTGKMDRQLTLLSLEAPLNDAGRDPDELRRSDERMSMPATSSRDSLHAIWQTTLFPLPN